MRFQHAPAGPAHNTLQRMPGHLLFTRGKSLVTHILLDKLRRPCFPPWVGGSHMQGCPIAIHVMPS